MVFVLLYLGAIQRYFESRRRCWRELTDPAQQDRVLKQAKSRRVRACKQRVSHELLCSFCI